MSARRLPVRAVRAVTVLLGWLVAGVGSGGSPAFAAEAPYQVIATSPILVKARPKAGTAIQEILAEGVIDAPVRDVQAALMDPERFAKWMPYVKECRLVGKPEPDGSRLVYTRLELPMVTSRDYVTLVKLVKSVDAAGEGEFENRWHAVTDRLPERHHIIRLRVNEGAWHVRPIADGKMSHATYRFAVDPGGWIPAFAADMGNRGAVVDTFRAVEREAKRREAERRLESAHR